MTIERTTLVAIPLAVWKEQFAALAKKAERAAVRYEKAPPGDRREAIRYEGLCRDLERMVRGFAAENRWDLDDDAARILDACDAATQEFRHPWSLSPSDVCTALKDEAPAGLTDMEGTAILFELRHAFDRGSTAEPQPSSGKDCQRDASNVWRTLAPKKGVFEAIKARWHDQLMTAAAGSGSPLVPSGVNNQILSEGLRKFVMAEKKQPPVVGRVVYRDGSEARPFPLRALSMKEDADSSLPVLRVSLMSMRHPEMDATVDAAWLRNRLVSVVRPAAETDEFVYETSRIQLREVCDGGPVLMRVYQTGLEPAIVGFYRAVTAHLLEQPGSVEVIPFYHESRTLNGKGGRPEDTYREGQPWATR